MRPSRVLAAGAVAVSLAVGSIAAGCSDDPGDDGAAVTTTSTTAEAGPVGALPPPGALDLAPTYDAALAALGLRLTDRGGLIDRSGGGYEPSSTGRHLALYVEPIDGRTTEQYIAGIRDVAVVFGDVFERWPGLESYDVCQEPTAEADDDDPATEPIPVTQIELTKGEAAAFDWDTVTLVDLLQAALAEPPEISIRTNSELAKDESYIDLVEEARAS